MIQLSHLCMTTGKTIALTIQIFVSKVMSIQIQNSFINEWCQFQYDIFPGQDLFQKTHFWKSRVKDERNLIRISAKVPFIVAR